MQSGSYACLLCCVVLLLCCFTIEVWAVVVVVARVSSICSLSEMPGHCQHIETAWHCGVAANTNPLTNTSGLEWKCVTDCMVNPRPHIHWLKPFFQCATVPAMSLQILQKKYAVISFLHYLICYCRSCSFRYRMCSGLSRKAVEHNWDSLYSYICRCLWLLHTQYYVHTYLSKIKEPNSCSTYKLNKDSLLNRNQGQRRKRCWDSVIYYSYFLMGLFHRHQGKLTVIKKKQTKLCIRDSKSDKERETGLIGLIDLNWTNDSTKNWKQRRRALINRQRSYNTQLYGSETCFRSQ